MTNNQRMLLAYRLEIVESLLRTIEGGGSLVEMLRQCDSIEHAERVLTAEPWRIKANHVAYVLDMSYRELTGDGALLKNEAARIQHQLNHEQSTTASEKPAIVL